ncbi:MAG: hypothetical protein M3P04_03840 [Actinomycetota bacterium]|nr:hypothetical protein [Actinomycetota bacterium]
MTAKHLSTSSSRLPARAFALGAAFALAVLSVPSAYAVQGASKGNSNGKQTICHATNSNTNPYVVITPNKNGDVDGHAKHLGPIWNAGLKAQHIAWGDIIPPFDYNDHGTAAHYPGLNWTAEGQAFFANGCNAPTGGGTTGGTTTGGTTTGGTTTGGTTTGGTTTGGTTGGATTGAISTTGGTTTGGTTTGGGGGGTFTGGGGGTFTGGGGGTTVNPPSTLPKTGVSLVDQAAYGAAILLTGLAILFLTPRRRPVTAR